MRSGHAAAGMQLSGAPDVLCDITHPWALCGRAGGSGAARSVKSALLKEFTAYLERLMPAV